MDFDQLEVEATFASTGMIDATVLLHVLARARSGDVTARMPVDWTGVAGQVAESVNTLLDSVIQPPPAAANEDVVRPTATAQARDAALAAIAMQKQFAASASHELRTPTTSILGFVEEVLDNDGLTEEDRGFLEIVHRNAQRLSRLIDDLLILGQVEIDTSMMHLGPAALAPPDRQRWRRSSSTSCLRSLASRRFQTSHSSWTTNRAGHQR